MSEKNLQLTEQDFYSYLNKTTGEVETINILTGEIVGKIPFNPIETYKYSQDFAEFVCQNIRSGMKLSEICELPGFPSYDTVCRWKRQNIEFNEMLKEAKKDRAEIFMDRIITIAERGMAGQYHKDDVPAMRLATDGFEKAASAGDPGQFGKSKDQQVRVENLIMISTGIDTPVIQSIPIEAKKIASTD